MGAGRRLAHGLHIRVLRRGTCSVARIGALDWRRLERGEVVGEDRRVDEFSLRTRERNLERLASESFDFLVVGGGITGAGIAFDAASRGLKVALVERADFASGTSSRSSRFVHGGLRYLAHGELGLVRESLAERTELRRMAPHLVRPVLFMLPVPRRAPRRLGGSLGAAMLLYDVLGGRRFNGRRARATSGQAHARSPALAPQHLERAHLYWEATVDDARLTLT